MIADIEARPESPSSKHLRGYRPYVGQRRFATVARGGAPRTPEHGHWPVWRRSGPACRRSRRPAQAARQRCHECGLALRPHGFHRAPGFGARAGALTMSTSARKQSPSIGGGCRRAGSGPIAVRRREPTMIRSNRRSSAACTMRSAASPPHTTAPSQTIPCSFARRAAAASRWSGRAAFLWTLFRRLSTSSGGSQISGTTAFVAT